MKAVVFHGIGHLALADYPQPDPGPGEVLLRIDTAGICMTDYHIVQGHFPVNPPRVLGHEIAGVIEAVGHGVSGDWVGKSAGISPARFCGHCPPCRHGSPELCLNFECLGNTADGGFAEYTVAQVDQLVDLQSLEMEQAIWLEPLACVLHGINIIEAPEKGAALIVGAGTFGKLIGLTLKATTGLQVAVVDPNQHKVDEAQAQGMDIGWVVPRQGPTEDMGELLAKWSSEGLQLIVETSGQPVAIERAVDWAGPRTRILLFGISGPTEHVRLRPSVLFDKELTITATAGMTPDSFKAAEVLLRSGMLDTAALVHTRIGLDSVPARLGQMNQGNAGKVLVKP
jgi:D-arabinitol dehydrogenase (NADP+)